MKTEWILCPVCGNKTRTMIQENTEMRNFPLYCPKCKKERADNHISNLRVIGSASLRLAL